MSSTSAMKKIAKSALDDALKAVVAGKHDDALGILDAGLAKIPEDGGEKALRYRAKLLFAVGEVQERRKDREKAIEFFERSASADPSLKQASLKLVEHKINSGDALDEDMAPRYVDYVLLGPNQQIKYGALRRLQAVLRIKLDERPEDLSERLVYLEKLHAARPDINFLKLYLGRGRYVCEDYEAAIDALGALTDKSGESHSVLNILGRCHEKLSELNSAKAAYEKSLRQVPNQAGVHFRLGRIELKLAEQSSRA